MIQSLQATTRKPTHVEILHYEPPSVTTKWSFPIRTTIRILTQDSQHHRTQPMSDNQVE